MKNTIASLVAKGTLPYTHSYNETVTDRSVAHHELAPPQSLVTLAHKCADAVLITFADDSLGIEVGGAIWAVQDPHPLRSRCTRTLPSDCWQFLTLASKL